MEHLPVMYAESLQALNIKPDGIYVDCTFGRGGHSGGILQQLGTQGNLLALDRDLDAINSDMAQKLLLDTRFSLQHCCFSELQSVIKDKNWFSLLDGVLIDLGVSSPQLDNPARGFSFLKDGALDMRMNTQTGLSAADWLAQVEETELVRVLFEYGEERFARRIASAIVKQRAVNPLVSTLQLANLIAEAVPSREKHKHPATRTFQAIRIAINHELEELQQVLMQALESLNSGGRLVVISFHSLEDRIVKRFMRDESGYQYNPGKLPLLETPRKARLQKIGKAMRASDLESRQNPRARSAIMRVAERM